MMQRTRYLSMMFALAALLWASVPIASGVEPVVPAVDAVPESVAPVSLRPRFIVGQKSRFEVWTYRQTRINFAGGGRAQQSNTSMELNGEVAWEVERVGNDGSASCIMTIDWLTASIVSDDRPQVDVDSRRPAKADAEGVEANVGQVLRSITAVPLKVKMGADGTVLGVTGVDAIRRKAGNAAKAPDEVDFMESASDLATIVAAPAASVVRGPGGKWDSVFVWNHDVGKLQEQMTYTLAGTEELAGIPVATVVGSAKLKLVPDVSKMDLPAGSPRPDIRFLGGGLDTQIMLELPRGEAVGRNSVLRMSYEMRLKVGNAVLVRTIDETIQSQTLRIWEN